MMTFSQSRACLPVSQGLLRGVRRAVAAAMTWRSDDIRINSDGTLVASARALRALGLLLPMDQDEPGEKRKKSKDSDWVQIGGDSDVEMLVDLPVLVKNGLAQGNETASTLRSHLFEKLQEIEDAMPCPAGLPHSYGASASSGLTPASARVRAEAPAEETFTRKEVEDMLAVATKRAPVEETYTRKEVEETLAAASRRSPPEEMYTHKEV